MWRLSGSSLIPVTKGKTHVDVVCCSKGCYTEQGCAHHPTVAIASPIARKSTKTAESIVKKECHGLLLNLCTGTHFS